MLEFVKGELFDYALLYGMTADEYWFGDPALIYNYQNAFNLKQRYDLQLAWVQGAYFKSALGSTQVWCLYPAKEKWDKMPKYADNPVEKMQPQKPMSQEKKELVDKARARLVALGLLEKK